MMEERTEKREKRDGKKAITAAGKVIWREPDTECSVKMFHITRCGDQ